MEAPAKRILADKYEIVGLLGEGGTGVVYDAVRTSDGEPIALKVMHAALAGDQQIRGRFRREATILRRLEGPHVCPIVELGEVPGDDGVSLLYIALRKIVGRSLADVLAEGLLPVDRVFDIMLQVLEALGAAHAQSIIHRDLKPANILLEGGTNVIVVDFGMSKIVTGAGINTTNLTTHNMVFGTPEYMSPEQARGDELDARCDVYAAGIILYEMMTGAPPFIGPTPLSILTAHLTSDLEAPSKRPHGAARVTPALEAVIIKALARERADRYDSAAEFAAALTQLRRRPTAEANSPDAFASTLEAPAMRIDATGPTLISDRPPGVSATPQRVAKITVSTPPPMPMPVSSEPSTRTWVLLWVVVGLASVAVGVWFALR